MCYKKLLMRMMGMIMCVLMGLTLLTSRVQAVDADADFYVDLTALTYQKSGESNADAITVYDSDDFDTFEEDYTNGELPEIYITAFLYDGVGQVKRISKDDDTGEVTTKTISTTAININCTGVIEFSGTATDTMIAVDTNGVTEDITLLLNGISLTSSSSTPAIMVYNKDVTYSSCSVTISTAEGTDNYISGGKLKKVSTMTADRVSEYTAISSAYSDTTSEYYYVFSSEEVSNILYAQETADSEKVSEGDPYTYYKFSGAIGSDIELTFEGKGYLEVASQGDEGIETKGNINFTGGTGDYKITSYDDGINASTTGTDILINVNTLYVSVNSDGDEGDAIDSNGTIHIEGGTIYAFSHATSQDDGIDSDDGTYINGGTVIGTGNMADSVSDSSAQEFIKLNFAEQQSEGTLICITDTDGNPVMAFVSDRTFTTLTYSAPDLEQTTYYVYKGGSIEGTSENGLYITITDYEQGTQQQWSGSGSSNVPGGDSNFPGTPGDGNTEGGETPPDAPGGDESYGENAEGSISTASEEGGEGSTGSVEFTLSSSTHTFNNVSDYAGAGTEEEEEVHNYEAEVTEPTCTEQGYTTYTCTVCGESYVSDYTDALGHDYEAEVTEPTCTEQGYTTYTCTNCGESYVSDYTDALGHDYDYEAEVTEPTCTEQGYTTYTCTICGESYVSDYTDALGHDYEGIVTEPTSTEQGYTTYTCTICGESYVDDYVDALGEDDTQEEESEEDNSGTTQEDGDDSSGTDGSTSENDVSETDSTDTSTADTSKSTSSESTDSYWASLRETIAETAAAGGGTVTIERELGYTALPNEIMQALVQNPNVTLVFEYNYEGTEYTVTIPAGAAVDDDTEWYGPLWLFGYYSSYQSDGASEETTATSTDSAETGDREGAMISLWLMVMIIAVPGIAVLASGRERRTRPRP